MTTSSEVVPSSAPQFFGPAVFSKVLERFDVGVGDRFYDSPRAYTEPWQSADGFVQSSLLVTFASRGESGSVQYVVERRVSGNGEWVRGPVQFTTQRDFAKLVTLLP